MRFPKNPIFKLTLGAIVFVLLGCGVKGDPLPPERPADIGRGRPTYKRATEDLKIKPAAGKAKGKRPTADDDEDDDDERE